MQPEVSTTSFSFTFMTIFPWVHVMYTSFGYQTHYEIITCAARRVFSSSIRLNFGLGACHVVVKLVLLLLVFGSVGEQETQALTKMRDHCYMLLKNEDLLIVYVKNTFHSMSFHSCPCILWSLPGNPYNITNVDSSFIIHRYFTVGSRTDCDRCCRLSGRPFINHI